MSIPIINSFTPISGQESDKITISGSNFAGVNKVKFNDVDALFDVNTIVATVPSGNVTGKIVVTTPAGTATSVDTFTASSTPSSTYHQDFETTNDFTVVSGTWKVITDGSKVYNTVANSNGSKSVAGTSWTDYTVQAKCKVISWSSTSDYTCGLMARYKDANNYYLFVFENGKLCVLKKVSGSITVLASVPYTWTLGTWYTMSVSLSGNTLKLSVNGTIVSTTDSALTAGKIGLVGFNGNMSFDDVDVSAGSIPPPSGPSISTIFPTSGIVGSSVIISGSGFAGVISVKFGNVVANYAVGSSINITAIVPSGGTGVVSVVTSSGTATGPVFTVTTTPPVGPVITSISPTSGIVGSSIVVSGTGFTGVSSVKFGNVVATYVVNSTTKITATVPVGAVTGNIVVNTGSGTATSGVFTVSGGGGGGGKILYKFDFKDGIGIMELENDQETSYAFAIANAPVTGEKAARFEVRASGPTDGSSQRSELKIYRDVWHMDNKKDYWMGFKILLPSNIGWEKKTERWNVVFQVHNIPDSNLNEPWTSPPLALMVINNKWKIIPRFDANPISSTTEAWDKMSLGNPDDPYGYQGQIDKDEPDHWYAAGPLDIGVWTKWIFKMRFDWTSNGSLEAWKNDTKVVNRVGMPFGMNDALAGTFKIGLYRNKPGEIPGVTAQDRVTYVNRIIIGDATCNYQQISDYVDGKTN